MNIIVHIPWRLLKTEVQLTYNVVLVSNVQHRVCKYIYIYSFSDLCWGLLLLGNRFPEGLQG